MRLLQVEKATKATKAAKAAKAVKVAKAAAAAAADVDVLLLPHHHLFVESKLIAN